MVWSAECVGTGYNFSCLPSVLHTVPVPQGCFAVSQSRFPLDKALGLNSWDCDVNMRDQLQNMLLHPVFSLVKIGSDVLNKSVCSLLLPFHFEIKHCTCTNTTNEQVFFIVVILIWNWFGITLAYIKLNIYKLYLLLVCKLGMLTTNARCQGANSS